MDPFRKGGPVRAAATWLHYVKLNRDLESAWPLTHSDYREFLVDTWLDQFGGDGRLAELNLTPLRTGMLEDVQPSPAICDPRLWDQFSLTTLAVLDDLWSTIVWEHAGWGTEPRVVAPGHEVAVLFDKATEAEVRLEEPTALRGFAFELKGEDGAWQLSNVVANESAATKPDWRPSDPSWRAGRPD